MYGSELIKEEQGVKEVDCVEKTETKEILSVKHFRKAGIWMQHNNHAREIVKILFAIFRHKTRLSEVTFVPKLKESKELAADIFKSLVSSPKEDYSIIISSDKDRHVRENRYFNQRLIDERYFEVLGESIVFKKEYVDFINSEEFKEMDERLCSVDGLEFTTRQHKDICIQYNLELIELLKKHNLLN